MSAQPPAKRIKINTTHAITDAEYDECALILEAVYAERDSTRRYISVDFRELVDRDIYPDYYRIIQEPICLDDIKGRLVAKEYQTALGFLKDLRLVFSNALTYNEETSGIALDAKDLLSLVTSLYDEAASNGNLPVAPVFKMPIAPPSIYAAPSPSSGTEGGQNAYIPTKKRGRPTNAELAARKAAGIAPPPKKVSRQSAGLVASASDFSHDQFAAALDAPSSVSTPAGALGATPHGGGDDEDLGFISDDQEEQLAESLQVIAHLESNLTKFDALSEEGWMSLKAGVEANQEERFSLLLRVLKNYQQSGRRLADVLDNLPEATENPYLTFTWPLSVALIEHQIANSGYPTAMDFDMDVARLFEKARRWYPEGSRDYGDALTLQRMYQTLSSSHPGSTSKDTNFCSLAAGPTNARTQKSGDSSSLADPLAVIMSRVAQKDRTYNESVTYKGVKYSPGDFVSLSNPDEPWCPTIGQVFKVFTPTAGPRNGQISISVCWYLKPEQTIHPRKKTFFENEVLKTSNFADHLVEDIIEKVGCQFYTKAIRGRPKPPHWFLGWPLYVCDSRWNDKDRIMVRIKNWNSCIPDDLRKTDFMPIDEFSQQIKLRRVISPLLRGYTGGGSLGEFGTVVSGQDEDGEGGDDGEGEGGAGSGAFRPGGGKKLSKKEQEQLNRKRVKQEKAIATATAEQEKADQARALKKSAAALAGTGTPSAPPLAASMPSASWQIHSGTGTPLSAGMGRVAPPISGLPPVNLGAGPGASFAGTPGGPSRVGFAGQPPPPGTMSGASLAASSPSIPLLAPPHLGGSGPARVNIPDRSLIPAVGGHQLISQIADVELLSEETTRAFLCDSSSSKMLWFPAPPTVPRVVDRPQHSLAYLAFLARKGPSTPASSDGALDERILQAVRSALRPAVDPDELGRQIADALGGGGVTPMEGVQDA